MEILKTMLFVLAGIFGFLALYSQFNDKSDNLKKWSISLFYLALGIFLSITLAEKVNEVKEESFVVEYQEIKSFSLGSETTFFGPGSFVLGCGYSVSGSCTELKYYFYKKGQVGYILCSIGVDRVEIVETNDKPPGIEGVFNDNGSFKLLEDYIIYVPVGTIYEEYKVRL